MSRPSKPNHDTPSTSHSVFAEPHLNLPPPSSQPPSTPAGKDDALSYASPGTPSALDAYTHGAAAEPSVTGQADIPTPQESVWHEPALTPTATPPSELPYAQFLRDGKMQTSWFKSWAATCLVVLAAGPWAVLGAFWNASATPSQILSVTLFGPACEEVMKVAALSLLLERRPFFFHSGAQILFAGAACGLNFAVIENFLYLFVYIPKASSELWLWRWTICIALHVGCCSVTAIGLTRTWRRSLADSAPPSLGSTTPWLVAAILVHCLYNTAVLILEKTDILKF